MDPDVLTAELKQQAAAAGFSLCGVAPAVTPRGAARLDDWLAAGYAGQMHYLADRRAAYDHPRHVLDGARSVVMLTMEYQSQPPAAASPGQGRVSRYAWGAIDYHELVRDRLNRLADWLREAVPTASVRGVVDTAPLLEREFAQLAGLGWIGKHTLLLNRQRGSWFFLAALLTDVVLAYDQPHETDHCGTCRACLDACPTGAFPQPYVLDASRCISYLTIELKEAIPAHLREGVGEWLFGCDVCQEVCPWNAHAASEPQAAFAPLSENNPIDLIRLFEIDDEAFRARFRHTPLWRPKRRGILRNAAVVLGNRPAPAAVPALIRGLNDVEPLVRGAAAWSLGRFAETAAGEALKARSSIEQDEAVRREIDGALRAAVDRRAASLAE
ncbi:MAG: tRNA epoxyqueuosine(34) reductase QueG [Pirellulales bacterium]